MPRLTTNFINTKITYAEKGKRLFYRDFELTGFGLKVTHTSMTYFAEARVNGCSRRVTLGNAQLLSPDEARKNALVILAQMAAGHDPHSGKKTNAITLGEAFEQYLAARPMRPNTVVSFNRVMRQNLGDWLSKPVTSISKAMVLERYRQLSSGSQKASFCRKLCFEKLNEAAYSFNR